MSAYRHILGRIQVTRECNQECVFCAAPPDAEELAMEEIEKRITRLKESGTTDLMITGGEPTLRKDLFDILDYCKPYNFPEITIQTNGSQLSSEFLRRIKTYGNVKFNVSFHSSDPEIFEKISTKKENYQKLLDGLAAVGTFGLDVYLTIVISSLNYRNLTEHIKFIRKNFPHISHFSFNFIDPTHRARTNAWTVPTFAETEKYIHETVRFIRDSGCTFRIEKLPLCYMSSFEEYSSDIRREIFDEERFMSFLRTKHDADRTAFAREKRAAGIYAEQCAPCRLRELCPGINANYAALHGTTEVFPVFASPEDIRTLARRSRSM